MKKLLRLLLILVVLFVAALFILPLAFKGRIQDEIQKAANENLNATLAFEDVSLSLIKNFPNLTVTIEALNVKGVDRFDGVELFGSDAITATVDLMSAFGDTLAIREVRLDGARADVRVLSDGAANYDIAKASEATEEEAVEEDSESGGFNMDLQSFALTNSNIRYSDATFPMDLEILGLNLEGSGDFTLDVFNLVTQTTAQSVDVVYDGVRYLNQAPIDLQATFEIDNANARYTFKENVLKVNRLGLRADGWVAMPDDAIDMDLSFSTVESDILHLLSMVPAAFAKDLNGVQASGRMDLSGFVRGKYTDTQMPGFGMDLKVDKGRFQYPDLPKSVENISIDAHVDASEGVDSDAMKVDVNRFYLEMADNPVDLRLKLRNPYTDPLVDASLQAKVIFENLKDVLPLEESDRLTGSINANVAVNGRMSAIEEERYQDFKAEGDIVLLDLIYASDSLPYDVNMRSAYMSFSPQFIALDNFEAGIGKSDLKANGRITNYMDYALRDSLLTGTFNVSSELMDLNELMGDTEAVAEEDGAEAPDAAESDSLGVIMLPGNIDFALNARFNKLVYEDLDVNDAKGAIILRDKVAYLDGMSMQTLGGTIIADGSYDTRQPEPEVDMDFAMQGIDIQQITETFYTIEKFAPIAKSCTGRFSTDMHLECSLNNAMEPIEETIAGGGSLQTKEIRVEKFEPLNKLAGELGIDRLSKQTIKDVNLTYRFKNGRVTTEPFEVKLDGMPATIEGYTTFSQDINYSVNMEVPMSKLPSNLGAQASGLLNDINAKLGSNLSMGSTIPVALGITGTITDPKIKGNYGEALQENAQDLKEQVKEQVKEEVEEKIEEVKEDAIEKAREEADKIIADAQKKADELMTEARRNADAAKEAAYNEAQKVEDSAKNPLEKAAKKLAADKIRKEADEAHKKALEKAQEQADKMIADAEKRAEETINEAENR